MPCLHQLHVLKSHSGKILNVRQEVCTHWDDVAIQLIFPPSLIGIIRKESDGPGKAFDGMMIRWLNGTERTRKPITWRTLMTVFQEIDHNTLANDLESILPEALKSET